MKTTRFLRPQSRYVALSFITVATIYVLVFMDAHLRHIFETVATRINGAKVEAHSFRTNLFRGTFQITGLHVTNPFDPSENAVQIDQILGKILIRPLLKRKLIIEHLEIVGTRLFTRRAHYGATPAEMADYSGIFERMAPGFSSPALAQTAHSPLKLLGQVVTGIEITSTLQSQHARLSSYRRLDELKRDLAAVSKLKDNLLSDSDKHLIVSQLSDRLHRLQSTRQPSSHAQDSWASLYQDAVAAISPVSATIEQSQARLNRIRESLESLIPFVEEDVAEIKSQLKLPRLDLEDLSSELFSPIIMSHLDRLAYWINMVRRRMPVGTKQIVHQEVARGSSIHFGKEGGWPALVIRKITLTPVQGGDSVSGTITGITSDPPLYAVPCRLDVKIDSAQSGINDLSIMLDIDHRGEEPVETLTMNVKSFPIKNLSLNDSYDLNLSIKSAKLQGAAKLITHSNRIEFDWDLSLEDVAYQVNSRHKQIQNSVLGAAAPIQSFNLSGKAEGPFANVSMLVRSELGKAIATGIRKDFKYSIAAIDDTLKSELLDYFDPKRRSLVYELDLLERSITGELKDRQAAIRGIATLASSRLKHKNRH